MLFWVIVIGGVIAVIFNTVVIGKRRRMNLRNEIINSFGAIPKKTEPNYKSISEFMDSQEEHDYSIDNITWNDLNMDDVYDRINSCYTSIGEEFLYASLRDITPNENKFKDQEDLIKRFEQSSEDRINTQIILSKLGIDNFNRVFRLFNKPDIGLIGMPLLFITFACLPLVFIILMFINLPFGFVGLAFNVMTNIIIHVIFSKRLESWLSTMRYFSKMLVCIDNLLKISTINQSKIYDDLKSSYKKFAKFQNAMPSTAYRLYSGPFAFFEATIDYFMIFILYDLRRYNKFSKYVDAYNNDIKTMYSIIGEIDKSIAVLSFRKSLPKYTKPTFNDNVKLSFKNIYHPLLEEPVTNSAQVDHSSIITGSNASGKSTFIKAIAINGLFAQTINTCTAEEFIMRKGMVLTSIAIRDDLTSGDSYYMAEVKSLKRVLDRINTGYCLFFIDEILRGTNTIERIAASKSILTFLLKKDCLCFVATHDIQLTELNGYDNYHFSEAINEEGITFDYLIKDGPTKSTNALRLLKHLDFDEEILTLADELTRSIR